MGKYRRTDCIVLLQSKQNELKTNGLLRYPQRSDFSAEEVTAIKAFLGPWPRALEEAQLKPINEERLLKRRQKRIEIKRKKTQRKIEANKEKSIISDGEDK